MDEIGKEGFSSKKHYKDNGDEYCINDIIDNDEQKEVIFMVLNKLKEWIEFPEKHKKNRKQKFKPLLLTVVGKGGSGKSFIIHVIANIMQHLFKNIDTMILGAPTGTAAHNILSRTIHSVFRLTTKVRDYTNFLSPKNKSRLLREFARKLVMIFDERSMISQELMGLVDDTLHLTLHNCIKKHRLPFGGIPIVIIIGDDHQLPSVVDKCGNGRGAIYYYDKAKRKRKTNTKRNLVENLGMTRFLECANKVIELKKNYRTEEGEQELQEMLDKLREGNTLSEEQVNRLRRLHINNFSSNDMNTINEDATYVYANKDNCAEHNAQCLSRIVTDENPLAILKPKFSGSNSKKNLFKNEDNAKPALLCIDAKVCIRGKNFQPQWGLFNGAVGKVLYIHFKEDENPNLGDLPEYIIVDFKGYKGPPWNENYPTVSVSFYYIIYLSHFISTCFCHQVTKT